MLLQQRGALGVLVLTEPFQEVLDRVLIYYKTSEPMPIIVLPHPIQNVDPKVWDDRARVLVDAAERILAA